MIKPSSPIPTTPSVPAAVGKKPWPALATLATAGVLPETTARRTAQVTLDSAYLVHVLAALATVIVVGFLDAGFSRASEPVSLMELWDAFLANLASPINEFERNPLECTLILVGSIIGVEGAYILGALICVAWGAVDEPLRLSIRNAIQRAWLHTPHILFVVLLAGGASLYLNRVAEQAHNMIWQEIQGGHYSLKDIQAGLRFERQYYREQVDALPYHVRHAPELSVIMWLAGGAWWLWGLLRFIGAERATPPIAKPPMCEACGYNLQGISLEGRCPECGDSVAQSLGPGVRPGAVWKHRRTHGRFPAWGRSAVDAVFQGAVLGRRLRISAAGTDHRRHLAAGLPLVFVIAGCGLVGCYVADTGNYPDHDVLWLLAPLSGYLTNVLVLTTALFGAAVVGVIYRIRARRNLMTVTIQAACYLSGYLVVWTAVAFFWTTLLFAGEDYIRHAARELHVDRDLLSVAAWFLPNGLALLGYLLLISRITTGARYANA